MSTTPEPDIPEADDVEVRAVIDPAHVRRAPRYKGFFVVGVVAGLVLGLAVGLYMLATFDPARDQALSKPGVWLTVTVMGATALTTLIAGLAASVVDRRSIRRRDAKRSV
ncbi:hypothetical protein [Xylanimonas ulmi]|uniref:hypothetical protein n=1 Tax=Xylanimonas ulmi TaxID=228973 RepID=UPI00102AC258|nr:hypothetical protein [Xylanibacterium ulmi]